MEYIYENTLFGRLLNRNDDTYSINISNFLFLLLVFVIFGVSLPITGFFLDKVADITFRYDTLKEEYQASIRENSTLKEELAAASSDLAVTSSRLKETQSILNYNIETILKQVPLATHSFTATAYTAGAESTGKTPGHPAYGITKSGKEVKRWHTIAADPNVLPIGTRVYIPEFSDKPNNGFFIVEDTGKRDNSRISNGTYKHIQGKRIDIYHPDLDWARKFGRRDLKIIVIDELIARAEGENYINANNL